jgi:hypothetical protein
VARNGAREEARKGWRGQGKTAVVATRPGTAGDGPATRAAAAGGNGGEGGDAVGGFRLGELD